MIYIVTALMLEAAPLIQHFNLKKDLDRRDFPVFHGSDIILAVSGTGKMQAAMAAAALLTTSPPSMYDVLLNIGFCGIRLPVADAITQPSDLDRAGHARRSGHDETIQAGTMLSIWKVTDVDTGHDYYPDVLHDQNLPAAVLQCHAAPVIREIFELSENGSDAPITRTIPPQIVAVDMESAGIMAAARVWLAPHQVILLKIVSDHLDPVGQVRTAANKARLERFMTDQLAEIDQVIASWRTMIAPDPSRATFSVLMEADSVLLAQVAAALHLTEAMRRLLSEDVRKARLLGKDPIPLLKDALLARPQGKPAVKQIWLMLRKEILSDG